MPMYVYRITPLPDSDCVPLTAAVFAPTAHITSSSSSSGGGRRVSLLCLLCRAVMSGAVGDRTALSAPLRRVTAPHKQAAVTPAGHGGGGGAVEACAETSAAGRQEQATDRPHSQAEW